MSVQLVAWIYAACVVGVIGFQIALIAGAPWGHLVQGGQQHGPLRKRKRQVAGAFIALLIFMAVSVLSAAGIGLALPSWTLWATLMLVVCSFIASTVTQSRAERRLWAPINAFMIVCVLWVMIAR